MLNYTRYKNEYHEFYNTFLSIDELVPIQNIQTPKSHCESAGAPVPVPDPAQILCVGHLRSFARVDSNNRVPKVMVPPSYELIYKPLQNPIHCSYIHNSYIHQP